MLRLFLQKLIFNFQKAMKKLAVYRFQLLVSIVKAGRRYMMKQLCLVKKLPGRAQGR